MACGYLPSLILAASFLILPFPPGSHPFPYSGPRTVLNGSVAGRSGGPIWGASHLHWDEKDARPPSPGVEPMTVPAGQRVMTA
jgi:hypothetical protein